ncbi:MAG: hypothetical protein IT379_18590 [Deltaproteobacteria bacterium]|nr:hypothetical protein [Deltaproteobacteria bacterium]
MTAALLVAGLAAVVTTWMWCRPGRVTTARAFVEAYASAWSRGDVSTILRMEMPDAHTSEGVRRSETEREIARRGLGYRISTGMRYASERDHGDHVHVVVRVAGVPSDDMVLVRDGGALRLYVGDAPFACAR